MMTNADRLAITDYIDGHWHNPSTPIKVAVAFVNDVDAASLAAVDVIDTLRSLVLTSKYHRLPQFDDFLRDHDARRRQPVPPPCARCEPDGWIGTDGPEPTFMPCTCPRGQYVQLEGLPTVDALVPPRHTDEQRRYGLAMVAALKAQMTHRDT